MSLQEHSQVQRLMPPAQGQGHWQKVLQQGRNLGLLGRAQGRLQALHSERQGQGHLLLLEQLLGLCQKCPQCLQGRRSQGQKLGRNLGCQGRKLAQNQECQVLKPGQQQGLVQGQVQGLVLVLGLPLCLSQHCIMSPHPLRFQA